MNQDQVEESQGPAGEAAAEPEERQEATSAAAELRLIRSGQPTGDVFPISGSGVIGRFDPSVGPVDIDLGPIEEGVYISRRHAKIRCEGGRWLMSDLGSSNGTFFLAPGGDFTRIQEEREITDGQEIAFGNARFSFHVIRSQQPEAAEQAPESSAQAPPPCPPPSRGRGVSEPAASEQGADEPPPTDN